MTSPKPHLPKGAPAPLPSKPPGRPGEAPAAHLSAEDVAYLFDGSLEGLLSAVFRAYEQREHPSEVVQAAAYQPRIGQGNVFVETNPGHAWRVRKGVERVCGRNAFTAMLRASTCDDYDMGTIVYSFVRYGMARPPAMRSHPILEEGANPVVADLLRLARRAENECEKMRQFVRFSHLENGVWFARCNPNAAVVPLVMGYFADRLNDQAFIIHDEAHHMAGVYDGSRWGLVAGDALDVSDATGHDTLMQEAWKRFYDALAVDARYNPELRRRFIPVRLWQNVCEFQPRRDRGIVPVCHARQGERGADGR